METPDADSSLTRVLADVHETQKVRVRAVLGGWGIRQRLQQVGLHVGEEVVVKRSAAFGGPLLLLVHGSEIALGRRMAKHVLVEALP